MENNYGDYWKQHCPNAPVWALKIVAELTELGLSTLPGSKLGPRRKDYTVLYSEAGDVVTALDARPKFVKLDFRLPQPVAEQCEAAGEATIKPGNNVEEGLGCCRKSGLGFFPLQELRNY